MTTKESAAQQALPLGSAWARLRLRLGQPIDIAGIAYFRVVFGAVMAWEMWRFLDAGWVESFYIGKEIYFKYWPFTFVEPLSGAAMELVFYLVALAAILVSVGLFYRVSAIALFIGLIYIFLLDQTRYLNHFYLIFLVAFLMIFLPAHRCFSLDALRNPAIRSSTAPAWTLWLIRFQFAVPYFFGGIAKLNADWFRGEPMRAWLADRTDFPIIGGLFTDEPVVWVAVYGALLLDFFVVFLLLHSKTRVFAFIAAVTFHFMTARLFGIGIFPWVMIAGTITFFDADWPRRLIADLRQRRHRTPIRLYGLYAGAALGFFIGGFLLEAFSPWRASIGALAVALAGYHLALLAERRTDVDRPVQARAAKRPKRNRRAGGQGREVRALPRAAARRRAHACGRAARCLGGIPGRSPAASLLPSRQRPLDGRGPPLRLAYEAPGQELGRHLLRDQPRYRRNLGDRQSRLPQQDAAQKNGIPP